MKVTSQESEAALRSIRTLFGEGVVGVLGDGQLLDRFAERRGETSDLAFEVLVERHGPMVLRVCRGVLRDPHDAEDAFQATFLILSRKAGSIRRGDALGSWLYGVAHNVAATARSSEYRRRHHEREAALGRPWSHDASAGDDLIGIVREELARLPGPYRSAVVACDLEGATQHEAAGSLGWTLGTLQSRLARGRARLRQCLERRGLAPSAAIPLLSGAASGTMPDGLVSATAQIATSGLTPIGIGTLAERSLKSMILHRGKAAGAAILLGAGLVAAGVTIRAFAAHGPVMPAGGAAVPAPADGLLTIAGQVRMPDGSPAAGASVESLDEEGQSQSARADEAGRFTLSGVFGNGCRLRASSADGTFQARLRLASGAARTSAASPLQLTLAGSKAHEVIVVSGGRPVEGARVAVSNSEFRVHGLTDRDGRALLRYPAGERITGVVAWHATLGVDGRDAKKADLPASPNRLALRPTRALRVRVVDPDGRPVAGLELGAAFHVEGSGWIATQQVEAARVRTDADGEAILPWAPSEGVEYVDVDLFGPDWKIDEIDPKGLKEGAVTVHARREQTVEGRIAMPAGTDAEGFLVTGFGFGPENRGAIPFARARKDGRFTLRVPAEHGFVLGIVDQQWASDPWTGVILGREGWKAAEVVLKAYPATPLRARVTRGPGRVPVVGAFIELSTAGKVSWIDSKGKSRSGNAGVGSWLVTDAQGWVQAGVGRGEQKLRLSSSLWGEERTIKVDSAEPVAVEFHRAWSGDRVATGRLTRGGMPYEPSPSLVARAWSPRPPYMPLEFEPRVRPDGTFEIAFDAESLSLYFFDRERRLGAPSRADRDVPLDVAMKPAASYAGILLDESGRPLADRSLQAYVKTSRFEAVAAQRTDGAGRFRFPELPADVPLELALRDEGSEREYFLFDRDRLFQPGEDRRGDRLTARRGDNSGEATRPPAPLAGRVNEACRNARATGLRVLAVLQGDASQGVITAAERLLDEERTPTVLAFLPLRLDAARLGAESASLERLGWPRPAPGELALVAIDGDGRAIGTARIEARDADSAAALGVDFLEKHRAARRDALAALARAREEARGSGRRVWVIHGGPRCGPCFRMARWAEEHQAALGKDYVVVEVMSGVDEHAAEAVAGLPERPGEGIPWHAITEPDGTILATSVGPLGNIGFPSSVEEVRHLRRIIEQTSRRMTPEEREGLLKSFQPGH